MINRLCSGFNTTETEYEQTELVFSFCDVEGIASVGGDFIRKDRLRMPRPPFFFTQPKTKRPLSQFFPVCSRKGRARNHDATSDDGANLLLTDPLNFFLNFFPLSFTRVGRSTRGIGTGQE